MMDLSIGKQHITIQNVGSVVYGNAKVKVSDDRIYRDQIEANVCFLQESLKNGMAIYGTTTGFGDSSKQSISEKNAEELQKRLVQYHQCGTGAKFHPDQTIAIMLARLVGLAKGYSGVRYSILETLAKMINERITPIIFVEGSVGASGDLTPLSYIAGSLTGMGEVVWNGKILSAREALEKAGIQPIKFAPKEALALMNGTSVMTGIMALACSDIQKLCEVMEMATAMAVLALQGHPQAFDRRIHELKPFDGQKKSAQAISRYLFQATCNAQNTSEPANIQDVYSLRCAPHIIGVARDTLAYAIQWAETELNSVNDNPIICHEDRTILMGGNFYGGYISQACDSLKIAVGHLADLADRQLALLVDEKFSKGLPRNLVVSCAEEVGLNHGFKGMQIASSALTSEVLKNAMPASIFSRVTECCNQDKISLGTIASRDLIRTVELTSRVLAILSLAVAQAVDIRGGIEKMSPEILAFHRKIRSLSPYLSMDRPMDKEIELVAQHLLQPRA
ncbi:MAG: aromatic amino acid lyase [Candidatus Brocadiae bacterium]|nr:aromatic amino acid lyase [Candidatus Brocadiia bacterium]